jgi:hypothetical protein
MYKIFPGLGIAAALKKIPMLEQLPNQEAVAFVDSPYLTEPVYLLGDITIQPKISKESSQKAARHSKGKGRNIITPVDDLTLRKYDAKKLVGGVYQ